MTLHLVGLGLGARGYLTREAEKRIKEADEILLDTYTGWISGRLETWLEDEVGGKLRRACRKDLEDRAADLVKRAREMDVAVLVPGDPLIATTHISLILEAARRETPYTVIYGVSAYSAAASASGLQAYKFGRTITLAREGDARECYRVILENLERGLHTLVLLDTADGGLTIPEALKKLMEVEDELGKEAARREALTVGLARVGMEGEMVKVGSLEEVMRVVYPPPPHMLIFPGELHFAEADALKILYKADKRLIDSHRPPRAEKEKTKRYISKLERVLQKLKVIRGGEDVERVLEIAESYLEDARRFWEDGETYNALAAVAYAEGLLDGLRLTSRIEFSWD